VGIFFGIFEIRNSVKRQKMHHLFLKVKDEKKESIEHDSSTVK
jgi:hypothetical protein